MNKNNKGPIIAAAISATTLIASMGVMSMQGTSFYTASSVEDMLYSQQRKNTLNSAMALAIIEQFEKTEDGYMDDEGKRRDANGNYIPDKKPAPTPGQPTPPTIDPNYNASNKIAQAAMKAWQDFCNEGGVYNQGLYGSKTKARHDCSGFTHYAMELAGIPGTPTTSGGWWIGSAPGWTLVGTYATPAEVNAVAQPGDVMSFSGHVQIAMGSGGTANWGGYGGSNPDSGFPFNPVKACPRPNSKTKTCKLYRYGG